MFDLRAYFAFFDCPSHLAGFASTVRAPSFLLPTTAPGDPSLQAGDNLLTASRDRPPSTAAEESSHSRADGSADSQGTKAPTTFQAYGSDAEDDEAGSVLV